MLEEGFSIKSFKSHISTLNKVILCKNAMCPQPMEFSRGKKKRSKYLSETIKTNFKNLVLFFILVWKIEKTFDCTMVLISKMLLKIVPMLFYQFI